MKYIRIQLISQYMFCILPCCLFLWTRRRASIQNHHSSEYRSILGKNLDNYHFKDRVLCNKEFGDLEYSRTRLLDSQHLHCSHSSLPSWNEYCTHCRLSRTKQGSEGLLPLRNRCITQWDSPCIHKSCSSRSHRILGIFGILHRLHHLQLSSHQRSS